VVRLIAGTLTVIHFTSVRGFIASISRSTGVGDDLTSFRVARRRDIAGCKAAGLVGIDSRARSVFSTIQLGQA
jgi:hypothetical protein